MPTLQCLCVLCYPQLGYGHTLPTGLHGPRICPLLSVYTRLPISNMLCTSSCSKPSHGSLLPTKQKCPLLRHTLRPSPWSPAPLPSYHLTILRFTNHTWCFPTHVPKLRLFLSNSLPIRIPPSTKGQCRHLLREVRAPFPLL